MERAIAMRRWSTFIVPSAPGREAAATARILRRRLFWAAALAYACGLPLRCTANCREQTSMPDASHGEITQILADIRRSPELFDRLIPLVYDDLKRIGHRQEWARAIELHMQALEQRRRIGGAHHPEVGHSLRNLAGIHWRLGRVQEAHDWAIQANVVLEAAFPDPDHPERRAIADLTARIEQALAEAESDP